MELSKNIKYILKKLNENGEGYIVGGYTRDKLLGIEPKDCDFCTNINYEKLKEIFDKNNPKEMGKAFGIIQIVVNNETFEIAKFRKELDFTKKRNELKVEFVDRIDEDLKRRDFTINAIAYNGLNFMYPENAMEDIENKIIRFIGNGEERIEEDPLRILRGVRIMAEKDLTLEKETEVAILKNVKTLKNISIERVQDELIKIFKSKNIKKGLEKLIELNIFQEIFKIQIEKEKIKDLLEINYTENEIINMTIIFKILEIEGYKNLKLSNKNKKVIKYSLENFENFSKLKNKVQIKNFINIVDIEIFENLLKVCRFFYNVDEVEKLFNEIIENKEPIFVKDLMIDGKDIIEITNFKGSEIKKILEKLLNTVIENPKLNTREKLLEILKEEN